MPAHRERRYFIVKHDLESFQALPGVIWRSHKPRSEKPTRFSMVQPGDRWVEFAYTKGDADDTPCSMVLGFYECTREAWYGEIPENRKTSEWGKGWSNKAWMIEGQLWGEQAEFQPVAVPPINMMLGRTIFGRGAIIPGLKASDLEVIRHEAMRRQSDPKLIPLLGREPLNEQEVLSIVVSACRDLGIKIEEVQTRFPDMTVCIDGRPMYLELEYDSLSFWDHIKKGQFRRASRGKDKCKYEAKLRDKYDDTPVGILCWVDGDRKGGLKEKVRNLEVYELQSLLRDKKRIEW